MPFGRRHPDDISTVTRFSVPIYTAGETAGFSAVIHGLAHGVWYGLALVVLNGSEYMHVTKSLLEVLDESADVDARESYSRRLMLSLPGLPAGEYTIRLSVFDLFQIWIQDFDQGDHQGLKHRSMGTLAAGSWKQEWLVSTTVKKLHVQESGAGSASTEHGNKMGLEELSAESEPGLLTREHEGQVRQFGEVPQYEDEEWVVQSDRSSSSSTSSRLSACALASAELGSRPRSKHPEDVLLTLETDAHIKTDSDGVHLEVHLGANTLLSDAAAYILNVAGEKIKFQSGDLALHPPTPTRPLFLLRKHVHQLQRLCDVINTTTSLLIFLK
jgi:hypothetical protein